MRFFSGSRVPARTLGIFLASLIGGTVLSASTIGTSVGTVLSGTYSLNQDLSSSYIVYSGTSSGGSASGAMSVGALDSTYGVPVGYSYTLPIDLGTGPIALMAVDAGGGVTLSVNNSVAPSYAGQPWPYTQAESQIAADLITGNSSALVSFLRSQSGDFFYSPGTTQATFLAFSNGQAIGAMSLTAAPVAEPRSVLLASAGLGLFAIMVVLRRSVWRILPT